MKRLNWERGGDKPSTGDEERVCVCQLMYCKANFPTASCRDTCFISISNGCEGKLFKWHTNCCNGLFFCTSRALSLSLSAPLSQPLSSPFTLYYNDLLPSFCLSLVPRTHEHIFVSDSLMRIENSIMPKI